MKENSSWFKKGHVPWSKGTKGVVKGGMLGKKQSKETIQKRILKTTGRKRSLKFRERCRQRQLGKKLSPNHKRAMHKLNFGKTWEEQYGKEKADIMKAKIRQARINYIENNPIKWKITISKIRTKNGSHNSPYEEKIKEYLHILKIPYIQQYDLIGKKHYYCDFYIPSINLIIEVDGNYWHNYPIGTQNDIEKNELIIQKKHLLFRIWASEVIILTLEDFKNIIIKFADIYSEDKSYKQMRKELFNE